MTEEKDRRICRTCQWWKRHTETCKGRCFYYHPSISTTPTYEWDHCGQHRFAESDETPAVTETDTVVSKMETGEPSDEDVEAMVKALRTAWYEYNPSGSWQEVDIRVANIWVRTAKEALRLQHEAVERARSDWAWHRRRLREDMETLRRERDDAIKRADEAESFIVSIADTIEGTGIHRGEVLEMVKALINDAAERDEAIAALELARDTRGVFEESARKAERERDEARAEAQELGMKHFEAVARADQLKAERDEAYAEADLLEQKLEEAVEVANEAKDVIHMVQLALGNEE